MLSLYITWVHILRHQYRPLTRFQALRGHRFLHYYEIIKKNLRWLNSLTIFLVKYIHLLSNKIVGLSSRGEPSAGWTLSVEPCMAVCGAFQNSTIPLHGIYYLYKIIHEVDFDPNNYIESNLLFRHHREAFEMMSCCPIRRSWGMQIFQLWLYPLWSHTPKIRMISFEWGQWSADKISFWDSMFRNGDKF